MRKLFKGIDSMRNILIKNYSDPGILDQYDAIQLSRITKNLILALPEQYTHYVEVLKFHYGHVKHEAEHRQKITSAVVTAAILESRSDGATDASVEQAITQAQELAGLE